MRYNERFIFKVRNRQCPLLESFNYISRIFQAFLEGVRFFLKKIKKCVILSLEYIFF